MSLAAVLLSYQVNGKGVALVQHRIIKQHIASGSLHYLCLHVSPHQTRRDFLPTQRPIDLIVRKLLAVVGEMSQRIVNLADQQLLAVVQPSDRFFHTLTLAISSPFRLLRFAALRKF